MLARYYEKRGATVTYLISGESAWFKASITSRVDTTQQDGNSGADGDRASITSKVSTTQQDGGTAAGDDQSSNDFRIITSPQLHIGLNPHQANKSHAQDPSIKTLSDRIRERQETLERVLDDVKPTLIFIDEFCSLDYALMYKKFKNIQSNILVHTLPNEPDRSIPPLDTALGPTPFSRLLWFFRRMTLHLEDFRYSVRNPQKSVRSTMQFLKKSGLQTPSYQFYANRNPVFEGLQRWYLSAPEIDFPSRGLKHYSKYMGPMVDVARNEMIKPRVQMFLKKYEHTENAVLIYCGFGTVIRSFVLDQHLLEFYHSLNEIASRKPHWHILVSVPANLYTQIKPTGMNIMFAEYVPQLQVLPKTDVFITHGGGSVLEALYFGVPMMCVPPDKEIDYPGNAVRIKHHGLGLISGFQQNTDEIESKLTQLVENPAYRDRCHKFAKIFNKEYGTDYLNRMGLPKA